MERKFYYSALNEYFSCLNRELVMEVINTFIEVIDSLDIVCFIYNFLCYF